MLQRLIQRLAALPALVFLCFSAYFHAPTHAERLTQDSNKERAESRAISMLSAKLKAAIEDIGVVSTEAVTWGDASLGCPEPGKMYMQIVTPGYRVLLQHAAKKYSIHMDTRRAIVCDKDFKALR
ncbi:MAG: hypothetical protein K6L76_14075 [Agarilytica sp.]